MMDRRCSIICRPPSTRGGQGVNLNRLPAEVQGVQRAGDRTRLCRSRSKNRMAACSTPRSPRSQSSRTTNYWDDDGALINSEAEVDLVALITQMLNTAPLAGFVVEGLTPYGRTVSNARHQLMLRAVYSGLPVVRVGRGNPEGFVSTHDPSFIGGSNLTATKRGCY